MNKRSNHSKSSSRKTKIVHAGYALLLRNPWYNSQYDGKRKIPKFLPTGPAFLSRYEIHKYLKHKYPNISSKDYRIVGLKCKI